MERSKAIRVGRLLRVVAAVMLATAAYLAFSSTTIDWRGLSYNCGPTFLAAFPNDPVGETAAEYERGTECINVMYLRLIVAVGLACGAAAVGGVLRRRLLRTTPIPPRPDT
jgi:hypothetical protein